MQRTTPEWPDHISATIDEAGNMVINIDKGREREMKKKVLISLDELNALCNGYKDDYIRHNLTTAENNLELWFLGNEVIQNEESID